MRENLPTIRKANLKGRKILVRADVDVVGPESLRWEITKSVVKYLKELEAGEIKVIGHKGGIWMVEELGVSMNWDLRSDPREEQNDEKFAQELAGGWEIYVNEAFAVSHRTHASIVALPKFMKANGREVYAGLRFEQEVGMLGQVLEHTGYKVLVIGGAKTGDKARLAQELKPRFNAVLEGGLLPGAKLRGDGLDIDDETIGKYKAEIAKAEVLVVAGPLGKYEDAGSEKGTREIFTAAAMSGAYKIAGGGDTEAAMAKYGVTEKFDWISVGGGAMLEFLNKGTLPGIQALVD